MGHSIVLSKEDQLVAKIHTEFKEAFSEADTEISTAIEELTSKNNFEVKENITSINDFFPNSTTVKDANKVLETKNKITSDINHLSNFKKKLDDIRLRFPYKIISYSQVIEILEKYDLCMGPSEQYIDKIPERNAVEIKKYLSCDIKSIKLDKWRPTFAQKYESSYEKRLFVCAPHTMFNDDKSRFKVGRELFYSKNLCPKFEFLQAPLINRDPVVLCPIYIDNPIAEKLRLFHVVTAWGIEALDSLIFNSKNN